MQEMSLVPLWQGCVALPISDLKVLGATMREIIGLDSLIFFIFLRVSD